ncbi:MAG: hypothetical protein KF709_09920 [Gemmatimonadaceae bacterium]|nr:hypothetical protein [Gemmatimonadaceae bacterium]
MRLRVFCVIAQFAATSLAAQAAAAPPRGSELATRVDAAEAAFRRGERDEPRREALTVVAAYERNNTRSAADHDAAGRAYLLAAHGAAVRTGARQPAELVRSALRAFDAAIAADPAWVEPQLRAADLFLERYNAPDAAAGYQAVLERWPDQPRALLGLARVADFSGEGSPFEMASRAATLDPRLGAAHTLLARLWLDVERPDSARAAARRAVAADPTSLEAWGVIAAVAWLAGDSSNFAGAQASAERVSSRPTAFWVMLSEAASRQRRYLSAEGFAARAVALDSVDVDALGALGTNQLRRGDIAGGRRVLERAFALDPFHLWHKNTLDLLDHMATFRSERRGRFEFVGPERELGVLVPYLSPLLEEAYDSLAARYGYRPATPIRLEIFDRAADFSVRTVGLTGLGALGVSFGTTLAMDAPSARAQGTFNWGSTAWHELAHTFTLGLSGHRVPRWFSEGASVVEERRAREGWGATPTPDFLSAWRAERLRPVSGIGDGFLRPRDPGELGRSYYQASLVVEMIETEWGTPALGRMLREWATGASTAQVFQRVLGLDEPAFDARFKTYLDTKMRAVNPRALSRGDADIEELTALAQAAAARGVAAAEVTALERVIFVWPYDVDAHAQLAQAAVRAGLPDLSLRERRVIVALRPADLLEARYQLAVALREAGDPAGARREVLAVLEQAPSFDKALQLLVELRRTPEAR